MNLQHLKYVAEVAKTNSISKAAENLYMGQPNLSRAIKELEDSLGIIIFERSKHGITITPDGEEFLMYAKRILHQVDEVESLYKNAKTHKQRFSICVPRASYISEAFTRFASSIKKDIPAEIMQKYKEKRKDKHFPIVYRINDRHCSACGTELSMAQLYKLEKEDELIECENCRRLIFK